MTQVLVTRPEQDAASWVTSLQNAGWEAIQFPLLDLNPVLGSTDVESVLAKIQSSQAVMFVSANAVRFLAQALQARPQWVTHFNQSARAWCTGPGTAAALLSCGISENQIYQPDLDAKQLDSEALWQVVQAQVSPRLKALFIRGSDESGAIAGRDWLVNQVELAGAQVEALAAYQRQASVLTPAQIQQVHKCVDQKAIWVFSSSACVQALVDQCQQVPWSSAKAVVTHPRIAALAQQLGWRNVTIASPGMKAMLASIKSMT
jgi:uroporphyrinogen-III synthase